MLNRLQRRVRCFSSAAAAIVVAASFASSRAGELWEPKPISLGPRNEVVRPNPKAIDERWFFEVESGYLWKTTDETPLDYEIAPVIFSARAPWHFHGTIWGGKWVVRPQFSLLAEYFARGPETYYLAFSASPSIEWWDAEEKLSYFLSAGGGFGVVDSQDVVGAQGQDFTLNWFAKAGIRFRLREHWFLSMSAFFQHMSNRGMTDPNPGLDALGGLIGISKSF